jgi:tetratricopeptide (TPR) repeat protein
MFALGGDTETAPLDWMEDARLECLPHDAAGYGYPCRRLQARVLYLVFTKEMAATAFSSRRRLAAARETNREQPEDVLVALVQAETLVVRGDSAGARAALAKAVEMTPASTALLLRLAQLEDAADASDAAIARYRQVLELDPTNIVALNNAIVPCEERACVWAASGPTVARTAGVVHRDPSRSVRGRADLRVPADRPIDVPPSSPADDYDSFTRLKTLRFPAVWSPFKMKPTRQNCRK